MRTNKFKDIELLLSLIKKKLLLNPSKSKQTNIFTYKNETFALDKNNISMIQELIMQYTVNYNKENLLTKTYRVNKLQEKIIEILKFIFPTNKKSDLKKSPTIKTLFNIITEKEYAQIAYILNDNISYTILEQVKRHLTNDDHEISLIRYTELAIILGSTFMSWWYNHFFEKPLYSPGKKDAHIYFTTFCEKHQISFYSKDVELWVKTRKNLEKRKLKIKEVELKIATKIGSYFMEYFIKEKIFEELPIINKTRYLGLSNIYEDNIKMPLSLHKPLLHPEISYKKIQIKFYKYRFDFIQEERHESKYIYNKKAELNECLKTTDTKYCILKPFFDLYLNYSSHIKTIPFSEVINNPSSENAQLIQDYIYNTYQINIKNVISSCPNDQKLIVELLNYMQSDQIFNTKLSQLFVDNFKKYRKLIVNEKKITVGKEEITKFLFATGKYLKDYLDNQLLEQKDSKIISQITIAKFLWDAYDKIVYNKFFIDFFMKDAYFFSHFEHFYLKKEIAGITRVTECAYFLNYQTHRFTRGFLGYCVVNKILKEHDFIVAKNVFGQVLTTTKKKFENLTYSEYKLKTQEAQNEFLSHFFNDKISFNDLMNIKFTSLSDVMIKLTKYFKKPNEGLYSLSILHYMLHKKEDQYAHIEPIIVLDSTNSVTQHIANVFKDKTAAHFGCLTGSDYNDLNSYFRDNFNNFIKITLKQETNKLLKFFNIENLESMSIKTLYKCFYDFSSIPETVHKNSYFFESFFEHIDNYFHKINSNITFPELSTDFRNAFFAIINGSSLKLEMEPVTVKEELKLRFLIILTYYSINQILTESSWVNDLLLSRDIYKPRIMPEAYGMTSIGGYYALLKAIFKKLLEQGHFNINFSVVKFFAHIISSYFSLYFKHKELSYLDKFLAIRQYLKYRQENKSLELSTPYVTWVYSPKKIKIIRQNISRLCTHGLNEDNKSTKGQRRFLNIGYITEEVDTRQLSTSLCVHVIHTQETYVMMNWLITAQKLNKLLQRELNLDYFYTPNNDCFGTNFKHIIFLRYHIEHSYNACHNDVVIKSLLKMFDGNTKKLINAREYIMTLVKQEDDSNYWDGKITNNYFVKH